MISLLCPSRGRPEQLKRFFHSAKDTADMPDEIEIVTYIDDDDKSYDDVILRGLVRIKGPRQTMSKNWNDCQIHASGPIYGLMGDDILFQTEGWDTFIKQNFEYYPDGIAYLYGNDGSPHTNFGTHGFLHKNWVDAVGYFVPPYFVSDYCDTWLNDVAKIINRHVHIPILTEHMHPDLGKAEYDQTHQERIERHHRHRPDLIYTEKADERQADANKLRKVMK